MNLPSKIYSGCHEFFNCHCQGIAVDLKKGFIYYSFTTKLVKTDLYGHFLGSVVGLVGHLGCISFNQKDGRVYGSLEYKNDVIGANILKQKGLDCTNVNAFYCAIFDVDKITRADMEASSGVMRAVYLPDVVEDYLFNENGVEHKYGCSGIDGTALGPIPGVKDSYKLFICYGIYGDINRKDNDYQVILQLDWENMWDIAKPLDQSAMHTVGMRAADKLFLFTGNTTWGVQNLEYDAFLNAYLVCVYKGSKEQFPNYSMFLLDCAKPVCKGVHCALNQPISTVSLKECGLCRDGIYGNNFRFGSTGVYSVGNGYYYFSEDGQTADGANFTNVFLYKNSEDKENPFERSEFCVHAEHGANDASE